MTEPVNEAPAPTEAPPPDQLRSLRMENAALRQQFSHAANDHFKLREEFGRHRHDGNDVVLLVASPSLGIPMGVGGNYKAYEKDPLA